MTTEERVQQRDFTELFFTPANEGISAQKVQEFFATNGLACPDIAEDISYYQIAGFLFAHSPNVGYLRTQSKLPETILKANSELDEDEIFFDPKGQICLGYLGYGLASWNFVYKYLSQHLFIHIYSPLNALDFSAEPEEKEESERLEPERLENNIFLELCFKIIKLCLKLEKTDFFTKSTAYNKLLIFINDQEIEFSCLDSEHLTCIQGTSFAELFAMFEKEFEIMEQVDIPAIYWLKI